MKKVRKSGIPITIGTGKSGKTKSRILDLNIQYQNNEAKKITIYPTICLVPYEVSFVFTDFSDFTVFPDSSPTKNLRL